MATLSEQVQNFPLRKMTALLVVIALTVTAGILLVTWTQKADFQLLYANLSEEDAGAIVQKLNELKIPYSTQGGGVMVPADKVYEVRLQLASQGLPQGGGVGYELFDKTSFTTTDFVQKLNYRRALQGELSRTVRSLAEVEQCRVHLAVPEKSLFLQEEERPKASVLVKLRAGRRLSQGQIQGIVHLVSSSVEGLDPKDVSVVNNSGELLTSVVDPEFAATGSQMDYQRNFEKELETRVVGILEPVVGKGRAKARIAASFDFSKVEKTEERFDPDSQVARSEQRNAEKSTSGTNGGVPGVASNLPGKQQAAQPGSSSLSEKKNETVNYEISKTVSRVISATGEVKRLSVVVLVDGAYGAAQGQADKTSDKKYTPRSEEELRQFEDMVKKAVGFTAERGDEVKVVNMPFEVAAAEEAGDAAPAPSQVMPMALMAAKFLIPLVGVVLLFLFVIRPLMKTVTEPSAPAPSQPVMLPQTVAELQKSMAALPDKSSSREQLIEWSKKNPKVAASMIKGWLEE